MKISGFIHLLTVFYTASITAQTNTFPSSGNAGIGTTNPVSKVHIYKGVSGITPHSFSDLTIEDGDAGMVSILTPNTQDAYFGFGDQDDNFVAGIHYNHPNDIMYFRVNNHASDMVINKHGNIGIGTTTPNVKLQVKGQIRGDEVIAVETDGSYKVAMNGQSDGYIAGRDNSFIQQFLIRSNGVSFLNGGNVGIGTNQPDSKLTVKGNIHAEEVKVDLSVPGPDYVFKEDYDLRTLEEVQKYIRDNGHLPNIPSAREMEEHGVELGTMNMKLLEKIEELTLYILQQRDENRKNIEALNTEIQDLKKKLYAN